MNLFVANIRALLALWLWNLVDSVVCLGPPPGVASNEHRYPSPRIVILGATGVRRELCIFSPMTSPLIGWEEQPCQCACGEGQEFWWQELQPWLLQGSYRPHLINIQPWLLEFLIALYFLYTYHNVQLNSFLKVAATKDLVTKQTCADDGWVLNRQRFASTKMI